MLLDIILCKKYANLYVGLSMDDIITLNEKPGLWTFGSP